MANRRPIRRLRIPRRRRPVHWVTDFFTGTSMDLTAANTTELSCLEYDDWEGSTTSIKHNVTLKRFVFSGGVNITPGVIAAYATTPVAVCVFKIDTEDSDFDFRVASPGGLLHTARVLHIQYFPIQTQAAPNAQAAAHVEQGVKVNIDWRGGCRLDPDDIIITAACFMANVTSAVGFASFGGVSRALISLKG